MPYTELYCDTATGSNLNAGDDKDIVTSTNGDWGIAAANRFTAASGTPFSGVSVGDFASIYLDGASVTACVARVTAVGGGGASLTLSTVSRSGTAPTNGATGRTCTVGGKWKGPNGTSGFPFGFVSGAMTDASSNIVRVNFKNGTNYAITAAILHSVAGATIFQGYTTTPGDGGKAVIDGGTTGAAYVLLNSNSSRMFYQDLIFQNNGATGSANLVTLSELCSFYRCVFNSSRGNGISANTNGMTLIECEAYACNQSNTANLAGFNIGAIANVIRCIAHDNTGSNTNGFISSSFNATFQSCIADSNGASGFFWNGTLPGSIRDCVAYNNAGDGMKFNYTQSTVFFAENCILAKNGGYGINLAGGSRGGYIANCAYGAGTFANTSGTTNALGSIIQSGAVTLASNTSPWTDEGNGDFTLNSTAGAGAACRNAGIGTFTQTAASYAGTVSHPDIGAAIHAASGGGSTSSKSFSFIG